MEEECVIVDETSGTGTTPPQKKMKQSRLPFTPLQGKSPQTVGKQLKRKLSNSDLVDCKSPKTPRSDADSTSKIKNPVETELSDIKDTKEKEGTKDVEIETNDVQEETKSEKKEEVQDNLRKRVRTPGAKNKTPAKSTPSKETKKEKENTEDGNESLIEEQEKLPKKRGRAASSGNTPAKTPGKATPTDKTPGKATPLAKTPGKATPGKATPSAKTTGKATPSAKTPGKATPAKTPGKATPSTKTPGKATPAKTPGKATPAKTPGKATPSAKTPGKATPAKTPGKVTPSGKKAGKATPSEVKKDELIDESEKQENDSKENETSSKEKDDSSKKVSGLLQKLPSVSDDESEELDENKGEKCDLIEDKSNIEKLDGKEDLLKDGSKKRKTTDDENLVSNGTSKTKSEESQSKTKMESEKDKSLKKRSRNSLDAFVKKGAEAMALKEKVSDSIKTPKATNKSPSSVESKSPESVNTDDTKNPLTSPQSIIPKKLTPGQLAKESERLKKKEEREKERDEKLKQKQKEIDEKNKLKEDEKKKKDEEREKEKKLKEEERLQKEEEKKQKIEEKEQQRKELEKEKEDKKRLKQEAIDAKLKEKEELQLKKDEEKKLQEEEKKLQEEEELRQKQQAKAKFSSFFVAKKVTPVAIPKEKKNDYFCQFQVKNNMRIAPVIRHQLANQNKEKLDKYISGKKKEPKENLFVNAVKSAGYIKGTSARTYPPQEQKEDENDCEVIEEEDADGIGEAVVTSESVPIEGKTIERRKVLKFCENNRPPYRGTWRKKTQYITARHPFRKDEDCFNYDYDSDDDWEEEANGENLSDCEDEKDEEEEKKTEAENDYEVDNDFFVPHGYLSDDEGKSDQEEMENEMEVDDEKDTKKKKEQLKQKQTDFENEIKQKTRQLKPRVFGCLWMSEETTNKAYDQLLKVLNPYRAVVCCSAKLPIATTYSKVKPKDASKEVNESSQDGDEAGGASQGAQKFVKNFPEEVVPPLIKLLHCNRNSKVFLGKEFVEYWKKNSEEGVEDSLASKHGLLAKAKIEAKISDLKATWGKNAEEGEKAKHMMWTVPLEVREKYGLSELPSTNTWTYILTPKEKNTQDGSEDPSDDPKTPRTNKKDSKTNNTKDSKTPKITDSKTPKITAFAKKCSPGSSNTFSKTPSGTPTAGSTKGSTPKTPKTPSEAQSTTGSKKELFTKATSEQSAANTPSKTPKSSIANFFKKKVDKESPKDGEDKVNLLEKNEKMEESEKSAVITLD